jgi:hypothetical protein
VFKIPAPSDNMTLAAKMLDETRKIESALVQKLNCMYFVARKVSLPSVDNMLKKEKQTEDSKKMYLGFSKQLNDLLNLYFSIENECKDKFEFNMLCSGNRAQNSWRRRRKAKIDAIALH